MKPVELANETVIRRRPLSKAGEHGRRERLRQRFIDHLSSKPSEQKD